MVVLGKNCTVVRRTGLRVKVNGFASAIGSLNDVPVVDAVLVYVDEYTKEEYFMVVYNALYVPTMRHHLFPPFLMREAGLVVNEVPKIQSPDPDENTHSIYDPESKLRIPLKLNGIFSYFDCRGMTRNEMRNWKQRPQIHATPMGKTWNPYNPVYANEEAGFIDARGRFVDDRLPSKRKFHLIDETEDAWVNSADVQDTWVDPMSVEQYDELVRENFESASTILSDDADVSRSVASVSSILVGEDLADALDELEVSARYGMAGGSMSSCTVMDDLFEELSETGEPSQFERDLRATINEGVASIAALASKEQVGVTAERLSKIWRISDEEAQKTLDQTTQHGRYSYDTTISREFPTNDRGLRYKRLVDTVFFTDTMFVTGKAKSTRGYKACQVFVSDKGFVWIKLMKSIEMAEFLLALKGFVKEVGIPESLVCDPHRSQTAQEVRRFLYEVGTTLRVLERGTQWANLAERFIGILKNGTRADLAESNAPMVFWDYALERRAAIMNLTARGNHKLGGLNPYTATLGETADISNICGFGWFEWCYYLEDRGASVAQFPYQKAKLGRCLGPTKHVGNEMCQWVLTQKGTVVPRRTLRRLTPHELSVTNETERDKRRVFMDEIRRRYGDALNLPSPGKAILPTIEEETEEDLYEMWLNDPTDMTPWFDGDEGNDGTIDYEPIASEVTASSFPEADVLNNDGKPINPHSLTDMMIGVEVLLSPQGEKCAKLCKVLRRSVDKDGKTTGVYDPDPALNTMIYDCKFPSGAVEKYAANIIAQNVLEQVDNDGHYTVTLKQILDHRREGNAVSKEQRFITMRNGQRKLRQSTVGWKFFVEYTDGSSQWVALKDLKETNPVQVAEYVVARKIDDQVAFAWWVPYTLRKKSSIIASVKARAKRKTHKYGFEIPMDVDHAFRIDKKNGNHKWRDALIKEMNQLGVALKILENDEKLPVGYTKATGHLIFDVKLDLTHKARWVKDGHRTPEPDTSNYAGVVSRESVRIAFTYAAMMGLPVMAGDIRNAYLQAPTSEKHYIVCGREFGEQNVGKRALITRAIYGGRVAGRDFWLHLRECMQQLGFTSSKGDADVWYRPATKKDGTPYMEYCLLYVDDVLIVSENAEAVMRNEIGRYWNLKEDSIGKPSIYLGGKCREVTLANGTKCWAFGAAQYVRSAVENVEKWLKQSDRKLPKRADAPFKTGYRPEIDVSRELAGEEASYYQSLIGILRWIVELGRIDICLEVSMMSSHLALPREGHLEALFHIFAYLKKYFNAELVYDPTKPNIDRNLFQQQDWTYSTMSPEMMTEVLPPDMPEARGEGFVIRCYVDADHAGDAVTRRSRTGFIVFLNNAPIYWYSKRQGSVESSTYQAEFTAMKEAAEYIRSLRYRLRMMGIPVEEAAYIFGDNKSVLANTINPGSTLKKKCAAVAYHLVREGVARGEWITAWISTHLNIADLLTKPMSSGEKRNGFVKKVLQHIFRKE